MTGGRGRGGRGRGVSYLGGRLLSERDSVAAAVQSLQLPAARRARAAAAGRRRPADSRP